MLADKTQTNNLPPISLVPYPPKLPLSYAQQRLWFLSQLPEANIAYNMPWAFQIDGSLNVEALEKSLTEMIHRHENLRTTFAVENGVPYQVIHPTQAFELALEDLQALSPSTQQQTIQSRLYQEFHCTFNLEIGPLLKVYLLQFP